MFRLSEVAMGRHVLEGSILDGLVPLLVLSLSVMLVAIHAIKIRMLSKTKRAQSGQQTTTQPGRSSRRRHHKAGRGRKPNATAVKLQTVPQRDGLPSQQFDLEETSSEPEAGVPVIEADVERAEVNSLDMTGIEPAMLPAQPCGWEHTGNGTAKGRKNKRNKSRAAKVQECQCQVVIPVAASESEDEEVACLLPKLADEKGTVAEAVFDLMDDEVAPSEAPTTAPEDEAEQEADDAQEWGCSSRQVYYRELLLAHRGISLIIARGPPGLDAPAPKHNAQQSSDCIGVLGIRTDPCSKQK